MTITLKQIGFGMLLLLGLILAFSPVDIMARHEVPAEELLHQLHNQSNYIEPEELGHMVIDKDPSFQVIDIRTEEDFAKYHIPGAVNIPVENLLSSEAKSLIDPYKNIILTSNGNTKAGQAWLLMRHNRYKYLYVLHGGMNYWVDVYSNPKAPGDKATDDEVFAYQFKKSAGAALMGVNAVSENEEETMEKPKTVIKRRPAKKKKMGGC